MERKKSTGVIVHVLRRRENECTFLFLLRSGGRFEGQWWPVAGTCEIDEEPVHTVLRELREETGLSPIEIYNLGKDVEYYWDKTSKLEIFMVFVPSKSEVVLNYVKGDALKILSFSIKIVI